jgi:hypothetical protein
MSRLMAIEFDPKDVEDFLFELRCQPTYPVVRGDPLLLLYDLLTTLNVSEEAIARWFGPRGYLHVARHRMVQPRQFEQALQLIMEVDEDEESGSE